MTNRRWEYILALEQHLEQALRFGHGFYSQFLTEDALALLVLPQCLAAAFLRGIGANKLPVGILVAAVHREHGGGTPADCLVVAAL